MTTILRCQILKTYQFINIYVIKRITPVSTGAENQTELKLYKVVDIFYLMSENSSTKTKLAKNTRIFLQQTSPKNPFGPNYEELPYETKVAYKYNMLLPYIQLSAEDAEFKLNEQLKYTGALFLGVVGGIALGVLSRKILKPIWPRAYEFATDYRRFFYGAIVATTTTEAYMRSSAIYTQRVCDYQLHKYLEQGIKNGFVDYQISGHKIKNQLKM